MIIGFNTIIKRLLANVLYKLEFLESEEEII